jgi:hypothetical protein
MSMDESRVQDILQVSITKDELLIDSFIETEVRMAIFRIKSNSPLSLTVS